jgi:ATP-dependent DNA ligase
MSKDIPQVGPLQWGRINGPTVFAHACKLGLEGIVSKRKDSAYRSGRSPDWLKMKNANAPAVKREAEEDWGKERWR